MNQAMKKSSLPIIAGALYILVALNQIGNCVDDIRTLFDALPYASSAPAIISNLYSWLINPIIWVMIAILTAVFLLTRRKTPAAFCFAAPGLLWLIDFARNLINDLVQQYLSVSSIPWIFANLIGIAAYVLAFVFLFLKTEKLGQIKILWFLPGVLMLLSALFFLVINLQYIKDYFDYYTIWEFFIQIIRPRLLEIVEGAAMILACRWAVTADMAPAAPQTPAWQAPQQPAWQAPQQPARQAPQQPAWQAPQQPARQAPQQPAWQAPQQPAWQAPQQPAWQAPQRPVQPTPAAGSYDEELLRLKNLLDGGVITQEEFDAKKKQIWGL